jgi:ABC-type Zn2+ transport system substrate-binding protein/surface adhesin
MNMSFLTSKKPLNIIVCTLALTACNAKIIESRQAISHSYSLMGKQTNQAADAPLINYGVPPSSGVIFSQTNQPSTIDLTY